MRRICVDALNGSFWSHKTGRYPGSQICTFPAFSRLSRNGIFGSAPCSQWPHRSGFYLIPFFILHLPDQSKYGNLLRFCKKYTPVLFIFLIKIVISYSAAIGKPVFTNFSRLLFCLTICQLDIRNPSLQLCWQGLALLLAGSQGIFLHVGPSLWYVPVFRI